MIVLVKVVKDEWHMQKDMKDELAHFRISCMHAMYLQTKCMWNVFSTVKNKFISNENAQDMK